MTFSATQDARQDLSAKRGSVLLVTLLVVSLLLIVVLTLVTQVRLGLREISHTQNEISARNNARLGVELAIAELQRHAGPDQRITAPATTLFPSKDFETMSGELYDLYRNRAEVFGGALGPRRTYLTPSGRAQWEQDLRNWWALGEKHPRWTAVLDASLRADGGASDRYGEPVRNQTPVWLVSGNQGGAGAFTPLSALPADAVTLVGDGSAAGAAESVDGLDGHVRVPRVPVQSLSGGAQTGSFAYWVGDESMKANFAVLDPWFEESDITSTRYRNRLQVPQRIGWERLSGMADLFDDADNDLNVNDPLLERLASSRQIQLLHPEFPDRMREAFHHLTASSQSLYTDTVLGGLRKDLTVFFEGTGSTLAADQPVADRSLYESSDPRFGGTDNAGFPRTAASAGLPTWGDLADWHDNTPDNRAPVLAGYQFFTAFTHRNGQIQFHMIPLITLWNPYDAPLSGTVSYQLRVRHNIGLWNLGFAVHNPDYVDPTPETTAAGYADGHMVGNYYLSPLTGIGWYDRDNASAFKQFGVDFRPQNLWDSLNNRPHFRFAPFDTAINTWQNVPDPLSSHATWVTYTLEDGFAPGEVKVFSLDQTLQVNPQDLHSGSATIPLSNVYDPDFPDSYWFPIAEGFQKEPGVFPESGDVVRWYGERLATNTPSTISVELLRGGSQMWRILYTGPQHNVRWYRYQYSPEGEDNTPNQPSTWKQVYHFDDWQDEQKNISDTRFRSSPIQALANNRISPFLIQNWQIFHSGQNAFEQSGAGSVYRAFANFNLMASVMDPIPELDLARAERGENNNDRFHTLGFFQSHRGDQPSNWYDNQVTDTNGYAVMGWRNENTSLMTAGMSNLVLRQTRADFRLLSLGRLQQANIARYAWQPGFAIGNSEASPYVDRASAAGLNSYALRNANSTSNYLLDLGQRAPNTLMTFPNDTTNRFLDLSYVMNEALWDRYFLSSIPQSGSVDLQTPLANSRHRIRRDVPISPTELRDEALAAAHLYNVGALNVNSTSAEAWKALFTAFRDLRIEGDTDGESNPANTLPVSRTLAPQSGPVDFHESGGTPPDYGANASGLRRYDRLFEGFRFLTDAQIEALAERIVDEVRLRGPFYSIADFVNRRLVEPDPSGGYWNTARTQNQAAPFPVASNRNHMHTMPSGYDPMRGLFGLQGALQRAINLSGINGGVNHPHGNSDDRVFRVDQTPSGGVQGHPMSIYPAAAFYLDTEHLAGAPVGEVGQLMSHAPGFVTQADLLAMIGPALTARGDTFVIRGYGDSTSGDGGTVHARAYLEVVVQRIADPVTPAGESGTSRYEPADDWGRRFVIVSQRWLLPEEI
jgi:hypothetical protein